MALVFYPRGGSAQVVRYLARALTDLGHAVHVISGSLQGADPTSEAATFFQGLQLTEVDYTEAAHGFTAGLDPMSPRFAVPFHPSYEDRPGVPDRVFYKVGREAMDHLIESWRKVLAESVRDFRPDIAHLHHLNHLHLAALATPELREVSKVGHLHGTELKMLELMQSMPGPDVDLWGGALRRAAAEMQHLISISPDVTQRASDVLGVGKKRVSFIPNGVDVKLFRPRDWSPERRLRLLEELLVVSPRGWDESGAAGSVSYSREQVGAFVDETGGLKPTLLFVGRFLGFKRLNLLLEATRELNGLLPHDGQGRPPYNLLVLGGVPGEWEGEHPHTTATRLGLENVFFGGWLSHVELADAFNLADLLVAPSYFEPFGQIFLEAMATGLPVLATRSGGPLSFVVGAGRDANGWFCDVDSVDSLVDVLAEAMTDKAERTRRGRNGYELARAEYSWPAVAEKFETLYRQLLDDEARG